MNKFLKTVRDIVKYNTSRKYFADWSPKQLHNAYQNSRVSEQGVDLEIGKLCTNDICDTLWTEMSYNPTRFGKTSPFVFNNTNSIKDFCKNYSFTLLDNNANLLLSKIKIELTQFLNIASKYDDCFEQTGILSASCINIKTEETREGFSYPNTAYKMLSHLVACIHLVCRQNLHDYYTAKYRPLINEVCFKRHPDLERKNKIPCFSKIEYLTQIEQNLSQQVSHKNSEILNTQMCIENLCEYENPVDTTREQEILNKQIQEFQQLESNLNEIRTQLKMLTL